MSERKVPKLRFPEFSSDWENMTLGHIATTKVTNSFSRENLNYKNGDVKNIHYGDIHTKFQTLFDIEKERVPFINSEISLDRVSKDNYCIDGDLIFADASEDLNDVGKSIEIINIKDEKLLSGLHTILVRPQKNIFQKGFAGYLFKSNQVRLQIQKESQGSKVLSISGNRLLNTKFYLPCLEEQSRIADFLTSVDDKIQQLTQKKELLEQYKKGVMQQMFSQQICFKNDRGNDYPNWQEKYLKEIAEVNPKSENLPNNFYYVDLESVNNGRVGTLNYINSNDAPSRAQRVLSKNDILFQMVRPYQRNNLLFSVTSEDNYVASTGYAQLRARENYDYKFIFQMLLTENFVNTVMLRCTGTSYPAINSSDLSTITINIPKYEEQVKIADFLTSLDDKITQVNTLLEKTKLFKKSLLQQMFI